MSTRSWLSLAGLKLHFCESWKFTSVNSYNQSAITLNCTVNLLSLCIFFFCPFLGTCVCGECTCHDVDPTGDWGDIHGDTCECDERNCKAVYDRYSDDFCSGKVCV